METILSSPPRSWQLLMQRTLSIEDGAGLQADMSFTRWFRDVELVCAAPFCDVGPHSLAKARARAALAGGWGGTGMATVPPGRTGALAPAFRDICFIFSEVLARLATLRGRWCRMVM